MIMGIMYWYEFHWLHTTRNRELQFNLHQCTFEKQGRQLNFIRISNVSKYAELLLTKTVTLLIWHETSQQTFIQLSQKVTEIVPYIYLFYTSPYMKLIMNPHVNHASPNRQNFCCLDNDGDMARTKRRAFL